MARAIDGELLELEIANIANKLAKSDAQKALMGRVMYCVEHMPTIPQPSSELPPCYQPDGDGCAYQCYDRDDEPIDKCKECPLCYSDKQRHHTPPNEPLTWNELGNMVEKPVYIVELEDGESCWVVVHTVDDIKALFVSAFDQYDYGNRELYGQTWLAYRRLPEVSP